MRRLFIQHMLFWSKRTIYTFALVFALDAMIGQFPIGQSINFEGDALARGRGGGGRAGGGGGRAVSRPSVRPAPGTPVARPAPSRYHRPVQPIVRPGVPAGAAVRSIHRVARRTARRTAAGMTYYYGTSVVALPPACYSVIWEGMSAWNCGGIIYIQESSIYYPIEY